MRTRIALVFAGLCMAVATGTLAVTPGEISAAIEAYQRAQASAASPERDAAFARAAKAFARAASERRHPDVAAELWANAGSAFVQAQRYGQAVVAFRRALESNPRHARARLTLDELRATLPAWIPRPQDPREAGLSALLARMPAHTGSIVLMSATLLTALAGALGVALGRTVFAWVALAPALVAVAAGLHQFERYWLPEPPAAVVVADDVIARTSDSTHARARFSEPLAAGTEITISETRGRWLRVRFADGSEAWLKAHAVERVMRSLSPPQTG